MSKILWERMREIRKCFRWHVKEMTSVDKFCRKLEKKERNESHVFLRFRSSQFLELLVGTGKEKERLYIYIYTRKYNIYEYRDDNYITDVSFNVRRACGIKKKKKIRRDAKSTSAFAFN